MAANPKAMTRNAPTIQIPTSARGMPRDARYWDSTVVTLRATTPGSNHKMTGAAGENSAPKTTRTNGSLAAGTVAQITSIMRATTDAVRTVIFQATVCSRTRVGKRTSATEIGTIA